MPQTALSLLAHPDDAEILCAGTLIRLQSLGWTIHIVTATAGDCGTMTLPPTDISNIRIAEARSAAALINAHYHCLGEKDGMVFFNAPTLKKVVDLFRRLNPSLVLTHSPADYMADHEQVSMLARSASFIFSAPNISETPRPADAAIPHLYYCDPLEGIDHRGRPVPASTVIDISKQIETKTAMLAAHASQREWLRAHHGMDEYIDAMKRQSAFRGKQLNVAYAEGFTQYKSHAYPQDDLLAKLLYSS